MAHHDLAEVLDLDAEVLHDHHHEVISWVGAPLPERARIVDLGAGTGTGTLALARHLPGAELTAVDVDEEMLARLRDRAARLGLAGRIRTVRADLNEPWPPLGPADLVWAAASLHHMADPGRALASVYGTLRPGGLFAVTELDSFPRFLPDGAEADLEDRCHAELDKMRAEHGLHMHEDWGARLAAAGFTVEAERVFELDLRAPLPPAAGRYAEVSLGRMRHGLEGRVAETDLAALDAVTAGLAGRDDLRIRTTRTVLLARRPAGSAHEAP
jgi:ubiquinone/menaquinone biosynthesis C-methylase UbiE